LPLGIPPPDFVSPKIFSATIAAIFLLALYALATRMYRAHSEQTWRLGKFSIVALMVLVALSYPVEVAQNTGPLAWIKPLRTLWIEVFETVRVFIFPLKSLLPIVMVFGVILTLKPSKDRDGVDETSLLSIGALLFTGYLVGATAIWFLIPISFLIALY